MYLLHDGPTLPDVFVPNQGSLKIQKHFNVFDEQIVVNQLPNLFDLKGFMRDQKLVSSLESLKVVDGLI